MLVGNPKERVTIITFNENFSRAFDPLFDKKQL